jgi:hypothetical protein
VVKQKGFCADGFSLGTDQQESSPEFIDFSRSPEVFVTVRVLNGFCIARPFQERCPELMLLCVGIADNCEPVASLI